MSSGSNLQNISTIDGRYKDKTETLSKYFSEYALIKKRIFVELEYLKFLSSKEIVPKCSTSEITKVNKIFDKFDLDEAKKVKKLEAEINHDVKAIEYYLRAEFKKNKLQKLSPFIHIGLTSSDTNNIAQALLLKEFHKEVLDSELSQIISLIRKLSVKYADSPFLARTHGQPAVPTTFGKEFKNYEERLKKQQIKLKKFEFEAKLNGAVGNYNALNAIFPNVNWVEFSKNFLGSLGLNTNLFTTQILPYDNIIEFFQTIFIVNGILIDLVSDIWLYNMLGLVSLQKSKKQVGSSTMPQKINPIEFENAEGNLKLSNAMISFYQEKLLSSRLQRDLSDSTISRTFGTTLTHTILAWKNIIKGLNLIKFEDKIALIELDNHWEVLSEAIQTYLKSKGDEKGFEKIKKTVYGKKLTKEMYLKLIADKILIRLEPKKYIGLASNLAKKTK
ncbi:MAG: adenylosuccinate lyase [Patescibacteria group bacterium]